MSFAISKTGGLLAKTPILRWINRWLRVTGLITGSGHPKAVLLRSSNMNLFVQYWLKRFSWAAMWTPLMGRERLLLSEGERRSMWRLSSCKEGEAEGHLVEAGTAGKRRRNSASPCSSNGNGPSLLPLRKEEFRKKNNRRRQRGLFQPLFLFFLI